MFKIITILFLYLLNFSIAQGEVVKEIDISGNKRVSDETVKIYGKIEIQKNYSEQDLNKTLKNLYSTNFFKNVEVKLSNGILKIQLTEYPVVNELVIVGEPSAKIKEEILKLIKSKQKESFIKNNLTQDIETIKKLYASIGYNFSKINTKIREIDVTNLDLVFEIDRGEVTKISKVSFVGDKKLRERRLRDLIASEEDKFWKVISKNTKFSQNLISLDMRLLKNYYKSIGYYDVKITSNSAEILKSGNVEIIYSIDAGTRYIIKKIETNADSVFNKDIFYPLNKEYKKIIGSYYSPFKVKKLLEYVDEIIENNNLQFVEHNVEEIIEQDSITVKLNIIEGEKILVERINILGNNITEESVIRSELLLDEGDPFTSLGLEKSVANIKGRRIFASVKPEVLNGTTPDLKIININVEEQPTGEISAGAGLGTTGGSFGFNIKENNWLGQGKNIGFQVDISQESLRGTINYSNPNYDLLGNALNYTLSSTSNDKPNQGYENSLISAGVGTSFEQYRDLYANLGLSAVSDDLQTDSSASDSLKKQSGTFRELSGNYGFTYDKRDRTFMPTSGSIVSFDQSLPIYADKSFVSNTFQASRYTSLTPNVIAAGKFNLFTVNGLGADNVRISKRKNLGTTRLRGFESGKVGPIDGSDHIGGNYAASLNFEANLPNLLPESTGTDIGLFLDFGNVWGVDYDDAIDDSNKIRSSTGVAASWLSPLGPMTFVLSTNISKASTDKTEAFNFNLGTTF